MDRRLLCVAFVVLTIATGCSGSVASSSAPSVPSPSATARPSGPGPSVESPNPSLPAPSAAGPHLTYVALGDSLLYAHEGDCNSCTSAAVIYGAKARTDLGIPVEVHNLTMHNGLKSPGLLDYLINGAQIGRAGEDVRKAVASADIVSVTIGFNDSSVADAERLPAFSKAYETILDGILTQIDTLRAGKPTIVRVTEIYNNGIAERRDLDPDGPGTGVDLWKPVTEAQNKVICAVAKAHAAICVDIYHAFNGPDGLSSPKTAGYLGPDGVHPSQLGQDLIAAAMTKTGYAPLR